MKPHIRFTLGHWVCRCQYYVGDGATPSAAYRAWANMRTAFDDRWYVVAHNVLRHFWRNVLKFR